MARDPEKKKTGRLAQIKQTYDVTKRTYPKIGWLLLAIFLGVWAIFIVSTMLLSDSWLTRSLFILLGFTTALLATSFIFGKRAEKAAYSQISGQLGAAAAVLQSMRGGWFTTPAVAVTKNQDLLHMVIGRPGVVLVAEGSESRVGHLSTSQRKKIERWIPDVPVTELVVGDGDGQVELTKLTKTVQKLPKVLSPAEVTEIRRRIDAALKAGNQLPVPKGPLPKNARVPRPPKNAR
jgi:hypothetical protein